MIKKEDIKEVAEEKIKELGGFFVDLKVTKGNAITLFFDRFDGVKVEHCVEISKHIEDVFDRDIEDYSLTVCSAGLESPFVVDQQYHKYKGKEVKVLLTNGKRKRGIILSYEEDNLFLQIEKKKKGSKKEKIIDKIMTSKSQIKETKLKINFK